MTKASQFSESVPIQKGVPLDRYTTIGIGGQADWLIETDSGDALQKAIEFALKSQMPYKIIGNGSNVIFPDDGFRGLVIANHAGAWKSIGPTSAIPSTDVEERFNAPPGMHGELPATQDRILVEVDSGARVSALMHALHRENIFGLEWFAGIPATVGGAIFMNMHGGKHFFGALVHEALLFDKGGTHWVRNDYFGFNYDKSKIQETGEIVLAARLILNRGPIERAKHLAGKWARHKSFQPQKSAGCVFQNLSAENARRLDLPNPSSGYYIDQILGLKGTQIGGARLSDKHAAFIENVGGATCADVLQLIELVQNKAKTKHQLQLELEVEIIRNNL